MADTRTPPSLCCPVCESCTKTSSMHMQPLSLKNKNVHGPLSMTNKVKKSTMGICTLTGLILPKLLQGG